MWEGTGVWGCLHHSLCVCVCMCELVSSHVHTRKGALILYILHVEHTMGEVEATMRWRTSEWSPEMASTQCY